MYETEVLISRDPTINGSKEIHRGCLQEAIMDIYPRALGNQDYTLQNLPDDSYTNELNAGSTNKQGSEAKAADSGKEEDASSSDTDASTTQLRAVRTMAAIAARKRLHMERFDLAGAFLNAVTEKPIRKEIPSCNLPQDKATPLKKAPHQWSALLQGEQGMAHGLLLQALYCDSC